MKVSRKYALLVGANLLLSTSCALARSTETFVKDDGTFKWGTLANGFAISLDVPPVTIKGDPLEAVVAVKSSSPDAVNVFASDYEYFVYDESGQRVTQRPGTSHNISGVRMTFPITFRPNEVQRHNFDLSGLFDLMPGRYTISVKWPVRIYSAQNAPANDEGSHSGALQLDSGSTLVGYVVSQKSQFTIK